MRRARVVLLGVVSLVVVGVGIAHAAETERANHVSSGIRHGCPYDPGCVDEDPAGDFNRHGYNRVVDRVPMERAEVAIFRAGDLAAASVEVVAIGCFNCKRLDVQHDTQGQPECLYLTFHYARDRLEGHLHGTLGYPC